MKCLNSKSSRFGFGFGFALLELLIAVVLFSIGTLGAAAMQISGLRSVHNAYLLSQAAVLAEDISERMRANLAGVKANAYHLTHLDPNYHSTDYQACYTPTGCSADQLAGSDIQAWYQTLNTLLPVADGLVCIDSTPDDGSGSRIGEHQCDSIGDAYVVKIWWQDNNQDGTSRRHSFRTKP